MKILKNSKDIAKAIKDIFTDVKGERVIVVAYVGNNAISYIQNPKDIQLYCSTDIPGTNPAGLRRLKNSGVIIHEVKKLHSKIYWSNTGVVICSANLSDNGLSGNMNHEFGVLLNPGEFDINPYITKLKSTPIQYSDIERLEKKYNLYLLKNKMARTKGKNNTQVFSEWSKKKGPSWKIFGWSAEVDLPKDVKSQLNDKYPNIEEYEYIQGENINSFEIGGWVLCAKEEYKGNDLVKTSNLSWFIPEIVIQSKQKNTEDSPFYWITIGSGLPAVKPFNISHKKFEKAFNNSYMDFSHTGGKINTKNNLPTSKFIKSLQNKP